MQAFYIDAHLLRVSIVLTTAPASERGAATRASSLVRSSGLNTLDTASSRPRLSPWCGDTNIFSILTDSQSSIQMPMCPYTVIQSSLIEPLNHAPSISRPMNRSGTATSS